MDLYYRNKGRFREKRYIAYADLSVSEELDGYPVGRLTFSMFTAYNPNARIPGSGDGYLGLGYPDIERTIPDHNVLDVMMANGMIDYKRFTLFCVWYVTQFAHHSLHDKHVFYLILLYHSATHRNNLEPDARIVFGSHGTINPQEFHMVPLENAHGGWRVHVESLRTPLRGIFHRRFVASLDSTSWLNKIAVDRAGLINTALGATLHGELYIVNCDGLAQLPNLIFGLQGVDLTLTPQQYILREETHAGTRCFSSIVPDPEILTGSIVLGVSFMEHFITIFDQQSKKVGFKPRVC
ncbi:hypothetical protein T265_05070 [Opisthorchis viverrini]|uniref:Peptidase A1 domain-containing protein n=1 Tax=Opisthorchis viverrini TaxID=6198 RepID=A0A075AFR4_OPIVI|nr:hypothetical protein T265_05070 [Opisthorchis viverrini]KER28024.1 hypothetical protein T265_05070 [Opisthorchis viverrini]